MQLPAPAGPVLPAPPSFGDHEGRDAVQGLRSSTAVTNDLAQAITRLGEELAADQAGQHYPDFRLIVEGTSMDLVPFVRDEVYRIACEALHNAVRHAQAGRVEVEILYAKRQLRLWIRDNGKGIDPKVLAEGERGCEVLPEYNVQWLALLLGVMMLSDLVWISLVLLGFTSLAQPAHE